jgi:hypothetical protein
MSSQCVDCEKLEELMCLQLQGGLNLNVSLVVVESRGCPHPYFLQQTDQLDSLAGSQYGHGFLHVYGVFLESSLD